MVRNGVEMSLRESRLVKALESIREAADRRDVKACYDLADQALK